MSSLCMKFVKVENENENERLRIVLRSRRRASVDAAVLSALVLALGAGTALAIASGSVPSSDRAERRVAKRAPEPLPPKPLPSAPERPPAPQLVVPAKPTLRTLTFAVTPSRDAKTGGVTVEVQGEALYPDEVVLVVTLRHARSKSPFSSVRATVKDRAFAAKLGPFTKTIPGGPRVAAAFFIDSAQSYAVSRRLAEAQLRKTEGFEVPLRLEGGETEAQSIRAELDVIASARVRLLGADAAFLGTPLDGSPATLAAVSRLDDELKVIALDVNRWARGRQCLVFASEVQKLAKLRTLIRTASMDDRVREEIAPLAEELRVFVEEQRRVSPR